MEQPSPTLLYDRVARQVEEQISRGALCAGDRVPSVRTLARSAGVSIATVNQAYLQLERRGLLRARPRSGYFVAAPSPALPLPASGTPAGRRPRSVASEVIDTVLQSLRRTDLLALNSAASAFTKRLDARLNRLTRQVLREQPALPNTLTVPPGDSALRRAIAQRLALAGMPVSPEHIVVTAGAMEAIALSLGVLCRAGDTVLVESPTYFGVLQAVEHFRLKVVEVANRPGGGIDVDAVAAVVARQPVAAAVLMPNFNNPTGALTSDAGKARLAAVLGAAGVPVIEDDIYGELHLGAERPRLLASFGGDGAVITCGSVSKSLAMGYRIGWAVSAEHAGDIARAKFCTSVACPILQQRVLARYFDSGGYDRHLRQLREELNLDCRRYREAIARHFPQGTAVSDPAGGLVLWLELPADVDGLALFEHALGERIGIAPGMIFSAKGEYRNYVRLAMGGGWNASIEDALRRLGRLAAGHRVCAQSGGSAG
jgi:DNA-binding transcriptional MocR family regulator